MYCFLPQLTGCSYQPVVRRRLGAVSVLEIGRAKRNGCRLDKVTLGAISYQDFAAAALRA